MCIFFKYFNFFLRIREKNTRNRVLIEIFLYFWQIKNPSLHIDEKYFFVHSGKNNCTQAQLKNSHLNSAIKNLNPDCVLTACLAMT